MDLDVETLEALGYQAAEWLTCVETFLELKVARAARGNARTKAVRPEKCPGCGKVLRQDLGSRVRHYCNRKCERKAKRPALPTACVVCQKPITQNAACSPVRRVCSDKCRRTKNNPNKRIKP